MKNPRLTDRMIDAIRKVRENGLWESDFKGILIEEWDKIKPKTEKIEVWECNSIHPCRVVPGNGSVACNKGTLRDCSNMQHKKIHEFGYTPEVED